MRCTPLREQGAACHLSRAYQRRALLSEAHPPRRDKCSAWVLVGKDSHEQKRSALRGVIHLGERRSPERALGDRCHD